MKNSNATTEENLEYYTMKVGEPLTAEEKAEIAALKGRPIVFDEDCPPTPPEKIAESIYLMRKYNTRRLTKEIFMKEFPERFKNRNVS